MKEKIAFVLLEMKMMWFKQKFLEWNLKWCFLDLKGFFFLKKKSFHIKIYIKPYLYLFKVFTMYACLFKKKKKYMKAFLKAYLKLCLH